jgi:ABC-type antimicrobial peptide transport system permease subunit
LTASLSKLLEHSRVAALFAWALSMLALVLASVGAFGVFAYAVEERRREIGVRLALGAAGAQIVRMLLSTSGRAMLVGLGLGLVLSLIGSPLLRSFLYGLSPLDPIAYGFVVAILAATAGLATYRPRAA